MVQISIKTNTTEVALNLNKMSGSVKSAIQKALDAAQALVWNKSIKLAPADTGRLRADIKPIRAGSPFQRILKSDTKYSIFVHEGTRRWPLSKPPKAPGTVRQYFKVAGEQSEKEIISIFQRAINNAIK
jgi:hypothetical protein